MIEHMANADDSQRNNADAANHSWCERSVSYSTRPVIRLALHSLSLSRCISPGVTSIGPS